MYEFSPRDLVCVCVCLCSSACLNPSQFVSLRGGLGLGCEVLVSLGGDRWMRHRLWLRGNLGFACVLARTMSGVVELLARVDRGR